MPVRSRRPSTLARKASQWFCWADRPLGELGKAPGTEAIALVDQAGLDKAGFLQVQDQLVGVRGGQADLLGDLRQSEIGRLGQQIEDRERLLDGLDPVVLRGGEGRGLAAPHHGGPPTDVSLLPLRT